MSTAWPTSLLTKIARTRRDLNENKALFESMFTRDRQVVSLGAGTADRWEGVIETVSLSSSEVRIMEAFLHQVGFYGEFTIKNPDYAGPTSGQSSALVQGAGQSGTSLIVDGVTPSVSLLLAGEFFQVGTEFKVVTADCTANGSGVATISFKPALRTSPADNAPLTLTTPVMLCQLMSVVSIDTDDLGRATFQIAYQESL